MPNNSYNHPSLNDNSLNRWFDTPLTSAEQPSYEAWQRANVPQPNDPRYDMQGYYHDIVEKGKNETAINPVDKQKHFPDTYKKPSYPTFSVDSKYATGPFKQIAGRWNGEQFIPSGVPTAEQEALQDPRIDPVFALAGSLTAGPRAAMGSIFSQLLNPGTAGKIAGLPYGGTPLVNDLDYHMQRLTNYGQRKIDKIDRPVTDKFGRDIFDEQGKMIPWAQAEQTPPNPTTPKIQWTKVQDILRKLMGDVGEAE